MKYNDLIQKVKNLPCFNESFLNVEVTQALRNQLSLWVKQKKLIRLKRGLYVLPKDKQKTEHSHMLISNILYSPSYISLEFALNYYGLIPEHVFSITAVSTRKTKLFQTSLGTFSYRTIKKNNFFGYEKIKDEQGQSVLMASPEKAILDKIYFDSSVRYKKNYFIENLRLQNFEDLRIYKLRQISQKIHSSKIKKMTRILIQLIQEEQQ